MRLPDSPGKIHLRLTRLRRKHALHRRLLMPLLCVWLFRHGQLARSLARSLRSHSYHPRVTERCKQVFKDRANEYFSFAERRSVRCSSIFCSRSLSRFAVQVVVIVFCADFVKGNKSVRTKGLYFRDFLCLLALSNGASAGRRSPVKGHIKFLRLLERGQQKCRLIQHPEHYTTSV